MSAAKKVEAGRKPLGTAKVTETEITMSRTFDAPRELVWDAYTDAKHADKWWGPYGFRNVTKSQDFRVGGSWVYDMHEETGKVWDNKITYRKIVKPERLEYGHGDSKSEHFQVVVTFEEKDGKTTLTMRTIFPNKEALEAVKAFGAVELGLQSLERLADFLAEK